MLGRTRVNSRKITLGLTFFACLALLAAACAPAAPSPTAAPAKPAATAAPAPAPTTAPAAVPTAAPTAAPKPAATTAPAPTTAPAAAKPTEAQAKPAGPVEKISYRMGFTWSSGQYYSMFILAKEKGIFAKYGLDPELGEGQGSAGTAQIVANKQADFAVAVDPGSAIRTAVQGGKIKMVGQNMPYSPIALLSKAPNKIMKPADIAGKKIGVPPGTTQSQLFPAFLKVNKIDPNSFTTVNVQAAAMQQALAQGQIDGFVSFMFSQVPILKSMGLDPHAMVFSEFGMKYAPGEGLIVHEDTIKAKPDLVKRVVAATNEAINYGIANIPEAADAGVKAQPQAINKEVATAQLTYVKEFVEKGRTAGKATVYMQPNDWKDLIQLLTDYADLEGAGAPTEYYTNDFVPASN